MGKLELSHRKNWQTGCGQQATNAERNLYRAFEGYFKGTKYHLHRKPKHLKALYNKVQLSQEELSQIYQPAIDLNRTKWGITPDFAIENLESKKILFGEIKRQDGWVENTTPTAGRGNVHERFCKLFSPGLLKACREIGNIKDSTILPFWVVFEGDITRDPKRNREIAFWFDKYDKNYFMWRPQMTENPLIEHFDKYLKPYLE